MSSYTFTSPSGYGYFNYNSTVTGWGKPTPMDFPTIELTVNHWARSLFGSHTLKPDDVLYAIETVVRLYPVWEPFLKPDRISYDQLANRILVLHEPLDPKKYETKEDFEGEVY